ncbi:putative coiled-coil domain-containing protein 195 isoform X1 [Aquila chrysaetos chrysaetos]|uniref:putative coiled-coil domain-containing protein 195 isoform X1 n=1 Tax=Aquila chrysaetos chrysaetos TaxID=223781 RepID=UPI00117706E1|nr:putative coiled-coil domain-containing protein 195 isoform X1 [Aquila chrysaetos chrysaetos]
MEGNAHLLQVIRKMRSQINKLERENRALRGELQVCGQRAVLPEREAARGGGNGDARSLDDDGEGPAGSPASLQGSIVAGPAPAPKEQTDTTMTVRRYSTASPAPAPSSTRSHRASKRPPSNGLRDAPGSAQPPAPPGAAQLTSGEGKGLEKAPASRLSYSHSSKMKLFQEHVCKCRGKVKAVSFLLPMDMSSYAEKQGSLKSPQNQSTKQLTTIAEKDM